MIRFRILAVTIALVFSVRIARAQEDISARLSFTTIDVPGAVITEIFGINSSGDAVGFYGQTGSGPATGFLYRNGTFVDIAYPGEPVTVANGINDSGIIVGSATQEANQRSSAVGFLYDGVTFTTLKDGSDQATYGYGISNNGVVVGAAGSLDYTRGFALLNGVYKRVAFPGHPIYATATGVNVLGQIVGISDSDAYLFAHGRFQSLDIPGAALTAAFGINDNGVIVGYYNPIATNDYIGFAMKNGKYISFSYPGAKTFAGGINRSGQIVGAYTFDFVSYHGFITSPITDGVFKGPDAVARSIAGSH